METDPKRAPETDGNSNSKNKETDTAKRRSPIFEGMLPRREEAVALRILPAATATGSNPTPQEIAAAEVRKKVEAECVVRREKEIAALTQQRISSWVEYQACKNEPRLFSTAEVACKPKLYKHIEFKRKSNETQARDCTTAK